MVSLLLKKVFKTFGICWANRAFRTVFQRELGATAFFEYAHPNVDTLLTRFFPGRKIIDYE